MSCTAAEETRAYLSRLIDFSVSNSHPPLMVRRRVHSAEHVPLGSGRFIRIFSLTWILTEHHLLAGSMRYSLSRMVETLISITLFGHWGGIPAYQQTEHCHSRHFGRRLILWR